MTTIDKPAEDPHLAMEALLCEQSHALYALALAIKGLMTKDNVNDLGVIDDTKFNALMFVHDQLRAGHEKMFEMHDWLVNATDDQVNKPRERQT